MAVTITAFDWVPDFAKGQVRDLRVRWALEEVGEEYHVRYLRQGEQKEAGHRRRQPYGQVPTLEEDDLTLFESGAIVHHIASTRDGLFPADAAGRARATEWMFAALNTVEPLIMDLSIIDLFEADKPWSRPRRPAVETRIRERLQETADRLGDEEWFDGAFTAGDLMMISVLRIIEHDPLLTEQAKLVDYVKRGTARPAFQRALASQFEGFTGSPPAAYDEWRENMKNMPDQSA
ncbi:glutathione S-transferase family protein [Sphingobium chungangianum]